MKIHFIAIGGSAMHNLAIALHRKGYQVTGSDDEIFEPSRSRLEREGILPDKNGWYPERITSDLDAVVLGMHAREDNPELTRARELRLNIYSYPEYVYEQTKHKTRVVIGGSHGKTTVTAMLLHVLKKAGIDCDYLVGAQLEGYDCMVRLSESSKIAVIEGDEYLSSALDRRPKFHLYHPNIALITGIAWDHINVFPTFENYLEQFEIFVSLIRQNGSLVYFSGDENVRRIANKARADIEKAPYGTHPHKVDEGQTYLETEEGFIPIQIFGEHNLQNLSGAIEVLERLGVTRKEIYEYISDFSGAAKRLELICESDRFRFYKDFAHAPSKLRATTAAIKNQYPSSTLIACMELHTFSSLNKDFLPLYKNSMATADEAFVYFSHEVVAHKKLDPISEEFVRDAFGGKNVRIFTDSDKLLKTLKSIDWSGKTLLMMSSGNFDGINFEELGQEILSTIE
jgi:UDP-N-acetylmuramate: L-alanyl-gamma-D-glutamyl-meso-diaminopimelate ligase